VIDLIGRSFAEVRFPALPARYPPLPARSTTIRRPAVRRPLAQADERMIVNRARLRVVLAVD